MAESHSQDPRKEAPEGADGPPRGKRGPPKLSVKQAVPPNRRAWLAAAGIHVVVGLVLLQALTFGHGLRNWFVFDDREAVQERLTFVEPTAPKPKDAPKTVTKPRIVKPVTPEVEQPRPSTGPVVGSTSVPVVTPPPANASTDASAGGGVVAPPARVGDPKPELRGVQPAYGDPRLWGAAKPGIVTQRDGADKLDSIISYAITAAADSIDAIAKANGEGGRAPGDWTVRTKNGEKWGWDGMGIRLGKVTIPNALLTLLPMNAQIAMSGNPTNIDREKRLSLARADILRNSSRAVGEAEFKKLLKELRERKEREHNDKQKKDNIVVERKNQQ